MDGVLGEYCSLRHHHFFGGQPDDGFGPENQKSLKVVSLVPVTIGGKNTYLILRILGVSWGGALGGGALGCLGGGLGGGAR